jgi:hypothetical protein
MFCPKLNFHNLEGGPQGSTSTSLFWGLSNVSKRNCNGPTKVAHCKNKNSKKTLDGPSPSQLINRSNNYVPTIHAPLIDLGQNRWWPQLGILRNFAQPMKLHEASNGPLLGRAGGRGVKPLLFSMCSHQVLFVFPSRTQWVHNIFLSMFPIAPPFVPYALPIVIILEPIWLAKYWYFHFLTFGVNTSILGSIQSLGTCLWWANQRGSLRKNS